MFDFADIDERAEVAFALETLRLIPKPWKIGDGLNIYCTGRKRKMRELTRETVGTTDGDRTEELELERPRFNPLPCKQGQVSPYFL